MTESRVRNLFISYAREDIEQAKALYGYLKPLTISKRLHVFFDTESIEKGGPWEEKIDGQLQQADAFIFLISRHYFESDFVVNKEMPRMIRRYRDDNIRCWPFCLSNYPWEDFEFEGIRLSSIQAIGPFDQQENLVPLNSLNQHQQEVQLSRVYQEIRDWIERKERDEQQQAAREEQQREEARRRIDAARIAEQRSKERQAAEQARPAVVSSGEQGAADERPHTPTPGRRPRARVQAVDTQASLFSVRNLVVGAVLIGIGFGIYIYAQREAVQVEQERLARVYEAEEDQRSIIRVEEQLRKEREAEEARARAEAEEARAKSDALAKRITDLLIEADVQISGNRLTAPAGDNALETLAAIEALDPGDHRAGQLRRRIVNRYIELANRAAEENEFSKAEEYLERATKVDAKSTRLNQLRVAIETARKDAAARAYIVKAGEESKEFSDARPGSGTVFRDSLSSGGKGPEMVIIPAGHFLMGSPESEAGRESNEGPQHEVSIKSFVLGKTEVTFDEYDRFARATGRPLPSDEGWGRGRRPVISVSWEDAVAYAEWLSEQSGQGYRLPTEAEWEYAARAGTTTRYSWGDEIDCNNARYGAFNRGCGVHLSSKQVGSYSPNLFGLYDMHGNVWEWTADCWHNSYRGAPADGSAWLAVNPIVCVERVVRGGSWSDGDVILRSAFRYRYIPQAPFTSVGFRLARDL